MKHSLKEIVVLGKCKLHHICNGVITYYITVNDSIYALELDIKDEYEFKNVYFSVDFRTFELMRWIRKAIENQTLIQIV